MNEILIRLIRLNSLSNINLFNQFNLWFICIIYQTANYVFSMFFDVERKTRFHVKRRAVIPEAPGSYFGSARVLFRKSQALISEALGLVSANGWKSQSSPNSGNGTAQGRGVHCEVEG